MKLSNIKEILPTLDNVEFQLEDGTFVPEHFHVTEVGIITKNFIDCGGTVRNEKVINFQLWTANDFDHRLKPAKLLNIIKLSEEKLSIEDAEIEVEYQHETIGKYDLDFNGKHFVLKNKLTACLASDACGIPIDLPAKQVEKQKIKLSDLGGTSCKPGSGCC
jgi:adenine deaminase